VLLAEQAHRRVPRRVVAVQQRVEGGDAAGVRERVEHQVDLGVGGQVLGVGRRAEQRHTLRSDPAGDELVEQAVTLGGVLQAAALDDEARGRDGGQDPTPGRHCLVRDLRQAVERPEGDVAVLAGRQRRHGRRVRRWLVTEDARETHDFLGVAGERIRRHHDRVRQEVVHGVQAGAGRVPPGGYLDRSRLLCEDRKPVAARVPREVHQNVDLVGLDPGRQGVV
jgi:hypothetical protein